MLASIYEQEHEDFRASVRAFLDRRVRPRADELIALRTIPRDLWRAAADEGYFGLLVPEEYGGLEAGDYRFNAVLIDELARLSLALASSLSIHFDVVAPYLVELSDAERRRDWLPAVIGGTLVTAIGMTEPSGGSDLAALRTRAERTGSGWLLNGSKTFITNGYSADLVVVAARTTTGSRSRGISLFAVEAGMSGFTKGRKLDKVGQPEADTAELFFQDVEVPYDHLLGTVDQGFAHMMERLPQERIGAAVANIAHARQILDETLEFVRRREAFGRPIGSFQHNKFLLADLVTRAEVTQIYVDQCVLAHSRRELSATDAAKAKWWSAQEQNEILDHCVQLHGGYGYMNEQRVARAWRDGRVTKIWAGSNEIMKELIGRSLGL